MIWHSKHVPITFKFGSEVGFKKCSKFYWNHFLIRGPVTELGELFKISKFKNPFFRKIKNQKPYNFFVFWATTTIHTFLKSSDKTAIIRQGQKSDTATGKGSGAKFSLYRRTHCNIYVLSFIKWLGTIKCQFKGHIWPWFQWKYIMNIQSHQTFQPCQTKPMFGAWFLTYTAFCINTSLHLYLDYRDIRSVTCKNGSVILWFDVWPLKDSLKFDFRLWFCQLATWWFKMIARQLSYLLCCNKHPWVQPCKGSLLWCQMALQGSKTLHPTWEGIQAWLRREDRTVPTQPRTFRRRYHTWLSFEPSIGQQTVHWCFSTLSSFEKFSNTRMAKIQTLET